MVSQAILALRPILGTGEAFSMAFRIEDTQTIELSPAQRVATRVTGLGTRSAVLWLAMIVAAGVLLGAAALAAFVLPSPWGILLLLASLMPFGMMLVGHVQRFLLALVVLDIPLRLGTHLDYHLEAATLGSIGGLSISVTTLSLPILYVLWAAESLSRRGAGLRPLLRVSLPLVLYVGIATVSALRAEEITLASFEVALLFQSLLLYVYVASTVRTKQDVLFLITMLLVSMGLESLIMLAAGLLGPGFSIPGLKSLRADATSDGAGVFYRLAGTVGSPNSAAGYLEMLLAPAITLLLARVGLPHKALAVAALALGGLALTGTFSRGGWAAFTLSVAIVCLLAARRGWLSPVVPLAIAGGAALLGLAFQDAAMTRLTDQGAAASRLPLIQLAFLMIQAKPVLGVGPNNFAVSIPHYLPLDLLGAWIYTVHNKYLLVWAETGSAGLVAFLLFLAVTLRTGWLRWRSQDRFIALVALGFTAAIVGQMAHMMVDIFRDQPQVQLLWLVAALLAALQNVERESAE